MDIGKKTIYNSAFEGRKDIVMWDVVPMENEQEIIIRFISNNSTHRQGIRIAIDVGDGELIVNDVKSKSLELWEDTAPKVIKCICKSESGLLSAYNVWDKGKGKQSQLLTSGMVIEENGNIRKYHCNDFGYQTNFDKLIFEIEKV